MVGEFGSGGRIADAPLGPLVGADLVGVTLAATLFGAGAAFRVASVNGEPGVVVSLVGHVMAVIALETHDNHVVGIRTIGNPDKLARLNAHTETPKHDLQRGTYQEPMMGDSRIGLRVRAAEVADFDAVQAIFVRASLSNADDREALLASPHVLEPTPDRIMQKRILVAVADKGELEDLFVDPSMMRHGVASQLVQAMVTEAPRLGLIETAACGPIARCEATAGCGLAGPTR